MGCGLTKERDVKDPLVQRDDGNVQKVSDIKVNDLNFIDVSERKITDDYNIVESIYYNKFVKRIISLIQILINMKLNLNKNQQGSVKKIVKKDTQEQRILKIVNKNFIDTNTNKFNIKNEIIFLSKLNHPNIVKAYEYYKDANNYYFVYEYVDSGSLIDRIIDSSIFNENIVKIIAKQLLEVLSYIHDKKIVHRDLSHKNILINSFNDEKNLQVKIIDWGSAVNIIGNNNLKVAAGDLQFSAPEVISQNYNTGCDIWSLGVIIYTLIEEEVPFPQKTEEEIIKSIKNEAPSFSSKNWTKVSSECKQLVQSMLEKDHKKRPKAVDLLKSKWFEVSETPQEISKSKLVENMTQFQAYNTLQQATMSYIATHQISQNEKSTVAQLDTNHTGNLAKDEIIQVCQLNFASQLTESQLNDIFDEIDIDKSGSVSYNEFITVVSNKQDLLGEENISKAFKYFDKDQSGFISSEELKRSLGYCLKSQNEQAWQQFMQKCDLNGDNKISFDEFKILVKGFNSS